jgi:hypothetical protein
MRYRAFPCAQEQGVFSGFQGLLCADQWQALNELGKLKIDAAEGRC